MRGPSYVSALKKSGIINKEIFSLYLDEASQQSYIDFGEPDLSMLK